MTAPLLEIKDLKASAGDNEILIKAHNGQGRAGLLVVGALGAMKLHSDARWESSLDGVSWVSTRPAIRSRSSARSATCPTTPDSTAG